MLERIGVEPLCFLDFFLERSAVNKNMGVHAMSVESSGVCQALDAASSMVQAYQVGKTESEAAIALSHVSPSTRSQNW